MYLYKGFCQTERVRVGPITVRVGLITVRVGLITVVRQPLLCLKVLQKEVSNRSTIN